MTSFLRALALAAVAGAGAAPAATAATVFATSVVEYNEGAGITEAARRITGNALGAPDGKFLSLGLGGSAIIDFGTAFRAAMTVTEVTFGNRADHVETMDIFGLATLVGPATFLGTVSNAAMTATLDFAGIFRYLKVVDTSPAMPGRDGFDIDSISVAAIPLPASGGLLALGLLGAAALRRRRPAQA